MTTMASALLGALLLLVGSVEGFAPLLNRALTTSSPSRRSASSTCLRMWLGTGNHKKVWVAGGSKGVGRETVSSLIDAGKSVVAMVRTEEAKKDLESLGATAIIGDAFTYKDVEDSMWGCDAAVTTLGGVTEGKRVDYDGNRNVVEAAGILGVTRLVYVTSIGCGDSKEALSDETYEVLKDALQAKEKVETQLEKFYKFSCDYTVIRPGGLITAPATGKAELTESTTTSGVIHRADVASIIVDVLDDEKTIKKTYSAVDPTAAVPK